MNGSHDAAKLQDLLDGFIRKFVLCPECDNPETSLLVYPKKQVISQSCKACGFHGPIEVNHKLNTFILKNPPGRFQSILVNNEDSKLIKIFRNDIKQPVIALETSLYKSFLVFIFLLLITVLDSTPFFPGTMI